LFLPKEIKCFKYDGLFKEMCNKDTLFKCVMFDIMLNKDKRP